ncbi:magnesium transporter [Falsirhodobacter halotolerans]|uniref:magnesium transporter n=1 Tax=Falsirhodobacter halotolerans TaxID=1146892 RepID=UPI001FD03B31|nr:magnesium transporter [Falsirhodobacter halotolerans]MCJ8138971.1 magnesium transporter [Falsirhodobacter halotolerans]
MTETDLRAHEDEGLTERRVDTILDAVEAGDVPRLTAELDGLHPADAADLLEQISPEERRDLLKLWQNLDGEVLSEISDSIREEVIETLAPEVLAEAVRELDTDDVVDILEDLDPPQHAVILDALDRVDRVAVERALTYPEYSAGRLMQRETVIAPEHWSVGETIDFLREAEWLPEQFYHVILVDPRMKPVAYVTLGRILSSRRDVGLRTLSEESFRTFHPEDPEAEVAYQFNQYHLISAPVVDGDGRLVGVITIDDAMNVLDEEHQEDILRLAGVSDESAISDSVRETLRARTPWLLVNLLTANISAWVISQFEATISVIVVLAALMPIIASMGGNAGTQSLTVAVRALATRDLTSSNAPRVVRREVIVGVLNGLLFALIMGLAGVFLYGGSALLGAVIAMAMIINLAVAAFAGVLVPIGLNKLKLDPALASGTFVMTLTDVVGFFAFLGLATVILL